MNPLRIHLLAGEPLFEEGDAPTTAFLIESGEMEIRSRQYEREIVLSRLGPGDLVGEMAVIDDSARTATAMALSDCVLIPINRAQIAERLAQADPIIRALLEGQLKRYRGVLDAIQGRARAVGDREASPTETLGISKIRLETQLRDALASGGLELRYQPILDIAAGRIAGYEALVRWNHPERGPVSPMEFVALAEETSLIVPFGEYVIDAACRAVTRMIGLSTGRPPFIAVNVSSRQLGHPGLIERIVARVDAAGVPRGSLKVEITESQGLDYSLAAGVITLCHAHGIRVALDDFGTGYSHLNHLHKLPFDTMKVDQSFTRNMLTDPRSMAIVEAIVGIGKAIGADIVVEGVETEEMLDALRRMRCDYAQGYLIGKPQTLEDALSRWPLTGPRSAVV